MNFIRRIFFTGLSVLVLSATMQPLHAVKPEQSQTPTQEQKEQPTQGQTKKEQGHPNVMDSWHKVVTLRWLQMTKGDLINIAGSMALLIGGYGLYRYSLETPVGTNGNGSDGMGANPLKVSPVSTPQSTPPTTPRTDVAQPVQQSVQSKNNTSLKKQSQQKRPAKKGKQKAVVHQNRYIHLQSQESLQQVLVANQRGNSCGYHALMNAQEIMQYIITNNAMPPQLDTTQVRTQLFGDNGQWRQYIKQRRVAEYSKRYLKDKLHSCMELTDEQKDPSISEQIYRFFWGEPLRDLTQEEQHALSDIANVCVETFMQSPNLTIQFANLRTLLQLKYPNVSQARQQVWQSVLDPQVLLPQTLQNSFGDSTQMTNAVLQTNPYTDNLFDEEIQAIIERNNLPNILVISDISSLNNSNDPIVYPVIQRLAATTSYTYGFVLRTSYGRVANAKELTEQELKDIAASKGTHWIAVVVHKTAEGAINYCVADSFYNGNRSDDPDVAQLINVLRGKPIVQQNNDEAISSNDTGRAKKEF